MHRIVFSKQADHDRELFPLWYYWYARVFRADTVVVTPVKTAASEVAATQTFYGHMPRVRVHPIVLEAWDPERVWEEQLRIVTGYRPSGEFIAVSADADQFYEFVPGVAEGADSHRFREVYLGADATPTLDNVDRMGFVASEEGEWAGFANGFESGDVGLVGHSRAGPGERPQQCVFHCLLHGFGHFREKVEALELDPELETSSHWRGWVSAYAEGGEAGLRREYDDMFRRAALNPAPQGLERRFVEALTACRERDRKIASMIEEIAGRGDFQMTPDEYHRVADRLVQRDGCRLLVFGLGHDSDLWLEANRGGTTVFVEDQQQWINEFAARHSEVRVAHVDYRSRRDDWRRDLDRATRGPVPLLPEDLASARWDAILVDGPAGHTEETPGRVWSIATAAHEASRWPGTEVFVHDCDRELEAACCLRMLGQERRLEIVGRLAVFRS